MAVNRFKITFLRV